MQTIIQKFFKPFKTYLPPSIWNPIRSLFTAVLTPILFSFRTGHFRSSFKKAPVSKNGEALPWYTYPCIDFLKHRSYKDKVVLEFGGGNSTLWWAQRAKHVVTFEGDKGWFEKIKTRMPSNVELFLVPMDNPSVCIDEITCRLNSRPYFSFDVIIIDGLYRYELINTARKVMAETGVILCDDSESYQFYEGFKDSDLSRIDFFGNAPGVILPHCTSIFVRSNAFLLNPRFPISVIAK